MAYTEHDHREALDLADQSDARYERVAGAILADAGPRWTSVAIRRAGITLANVPIVDPPTSLPPPAETREGRVEFEFTTGGTLFAFWTPRRARTRRMALVQRRDGSSVYRADDEPEHDDTSAVDAIDLLTEED